MQFKSRLLGHIANGLTRLLRLTLNVQVVLDSDYQLSHPYLFAFWHGKQFLPVFELRQHQTPRGVLISPSRDGDLLSVWLKQLGYDVIRGSSRKQNISALSKMMRALKAGYSLGFGIDGPIGPIYKVKPGMTHMAQKLNVPIVPVGSAFSRYWVVEKAWDKYQIPKPFSKAVFYVGKPMVIPQEADLNACNEQLEKAISMAEEQAQQLVV